MSGVGQTPDQATDVDLLNRAPLAGGLAGQLAEVHRISPTESFAAHISGAWGSGKSSLVNLTLNALREPAEEDQAALGEGWILPEPNGFFDAWRESQIGPAWWSLITWLRKTVRASQRPKRLPGWRPIAWAARQWFTVRETWLRLRLAGVISAATVVVAIPTLAATAGFTWYLIARAAPDEQLGTSSALLEIGGTSLTAVATLIGVGKLGSRWLTWRTPAGAKLFERRDDNPMEDVVTYARWLRSTAGGPILLVLDDVDRCPASYVVDLLEAVQTLLRGSAEEAQPLIVLVCADERWLHVAFETSYSDFAAHVVSPGRPLGHLFLAKLFQLHLRVPTLPTSSAVDFARTRLDLQPHPAGDKNTTRAQPSPGNPIGAIERATTLDAKIDIAESVAATAPDDDDHAQKVSSAYATVARTAMSEATQTKLRHELEEYIEMLEETPRAVIRFLNAYAIQRLTNRVASPDILARWTVLDMRWPVVTQRLITNPDLLRRWHEHGPDNDDEDLAVLQSRSFHTVVLQADRTTPALTANDVRTCIGISIEPDQPTIDLAATEANPPAIESVEPGTAAG